MAYTVPHTWVAGDFIRASWLQITTSDLIDHETRIAALAAVGGNVVGQASSVDSEIALFSGTGGKTIKRATTTGLLKAASGVLAAASAGTDYVTPTGSEVLTNKTLTAPLLTTGVQIVAIAAPLTDAQIKALPTTAITLVAAPAAGKRIQLLQASVVSNFTAGAYTNIGGTSPWIALRLGSNDVSTYIANDATATPTLSTLTTFLSAAQNHVTLAPLGQPTDNDWGVVYGPTDPQFATALSIRAINDAAGNFTGGNAANTLTVYVLYMVIG